MTPRTKPKPVSNSSVIALIIWSLNLALISEPSHSQQGSGRGGASTADTEAPRGVRINTDAATSGYTLFAPMSSDTTFLIDNEGNVLRTWKSDFIASSWVYMLDDGSIMRGGTEPETSGFSGGGQAGRFQTFDFEGELIWDYSLNNEMQLPHHDVAVLPNGNVVAIVWERITPEQARLGGRREEWIPEQGLWPDTLIELQPIPPNDARIVWQWRGWDHIIQNVDPDLDNFGNPADHPERIDVNGDIAGDASAPPNPSADIFHINGIAYNPELDQLTLSAPTYNELWVVDHSTTTEEAAGTTGGRAGMGGDLLFRWGNPQAYGRGVAADQRLGFNHDVRWIPRGSPGAGHIMVFSNRTPGAQGSFTQLFELAPPVNDSGRYTIRAGEPFGPVEPVWTYSDPDRFSATYISGAERLPTGNTLVSSGPQGRLFEITPEGEIVWEYWSPYSGREDGSDDGGRNPWAVFRAIRIPADHPGLRDRDLRPLSPQPPLLSPAPAYSGPPNPSQRWNPR